jgi:hypothetical protein
MLSGDARSFSKSTSVVTQDLEEIINTSSDFTLPNTVPASWLKSRMMGRAMASGGRYALIYSSAWLSYLRKLLEPDLALGLARILLGNIKPVITGPQVQHGFGQLGLVVNRTSAIRASERTSRKGCLRAKRRL